MSVSGTRLFLITLLMLVGLFNSAIANDSNNYWGIQYNAVDYDDELGLTMKPTALVVRMGTFINDYLAVEGRIGFGFSDDEAIIDTGTDSVLGDYSASLGLDIESLFGFYVLGVMPVSSDFDLYGLIGVSSIDFGLTANLNTTNLGSISATDSETENGLSYGVGTSIGMGENSSLNLEYMSYLDKSDYTLNSINVGFLFNF